MMMMMMRRLLSCLVSSSLSGPSRRVVVRRASALSARFMTPPSSTTEDLYKPFRRHPQLFAERFALDWLHDDFVLILAAFQESFDKNTEANPDPDTIIPHLLRKEMDGVYSFRAFSQAFVEMFNQEINNFYQVSEREKIPVRRPNSMNNYGVVVNQIGMRPLITDLQQNFLWPLSKRLFPVHASQFDDHHSFIVRYRAEEDLGLDMHTDDSDVTFNVCLGDTFTGAKLTFCGMFGDADHRQFRHTYSHEVGRAVIHLGSRRHGADDIESGRRTNLIVWNHNEAYRAAGGHRAMDYPPEEGPPSPVCLSYTHDRDFQAFKELPEAAKSQVLRPWCPPPGTEYDGFRAFKRVANEDAKMSQDDL